MNIKSLSRAFTSNLGAIAVSPAEQTALAAKGITEPTVQRYVLWRHATILMVVIATALSALLSTYTYFTEEDQPGPIDTLTASGMAAIQKILPGAEKFLPSSDEEKAKPAEEKPQNEEKTDKAPAEEKTDQSADSGKDDEEEHIKAMGRIADGMALLSLYTLPIAAVIILLMGHRFQLSFRVMVIAFAFSFFAPMLMALCPWSWWGVPTEEISAAKNPVLFVKDQAEGLIEAVGMFTALLPSVLSLIPGVQRACLRVKTLIPQALLPGWFLVVASPLYGLFLLVVVVAVDQLTGELAIIIPLALLAAASLIYGLRASVFTRPYLSENDFRRAKATQRVVGIFSALAGLILVYFVGTREVFGMHALGTDPKTSLMRPMDLVEFLVEVIARSMFVSALGAEFIMRMSISAWRHSRELAAADSASAYDSAMGAAGDVLSPEAGSNGRRNPVTTAPGLQMN